MALELTNEPERNRYEARIDGELGGKLVAHALDDVRARGLAVLPFCPFVNSYIEGHPEYLDLVPAEHREKFGL